MQLLRLASVRYHVPTEAHPARGARARRISRLLDDLVREERIHDLDEETLHVLPCRRSEDPERAEGSREVLPGAQEPGRLRREEVGRRKVEAWSRP